MCREQQEIYLTGGLKRSTPRREDREMSISKIKQRDEEKILIVNKQRKQFKHFILLEFEYRKHSRKDIPNDPIAFPRRCSDE